MKDDGYLMISRIEIKSFRCFNTLALTGLRRVNLLVGDSGSGKTALLETLFLTSCGNPEAYFRLRKWRGFGDANTPITLTREAFESLFLYLFHNGDKEKIARVSFVDSREGRRGLDIYFEGQGTLNVDLSKRETAVNITPITFKWEVNNHITPITLEIADGTIKGKGNAELFPLHYISNKNMGSHWDAVQFSTLSREGRLCEILRAIKDTFGIIEDLSLELSTGEALVHAKIPGFAEKIPINELSGGLNKYLSIALAIANNKNGVVCVDEIDTGFYHKHHPQIMRSLVGLCDLYSVQLFLSTHSWEFLRAAAESMKDQPEKLSLLRTRYANNECTIRKSDGDLAISAIADDIEVRD